MTMDLGIFDRDLRPKKLTAEEKFSQGFISLEKKYPALGSSNPEHFKDKNNPQNKASSLQIESPRKQIDLSSSKLSSLDNNNPTPLLGKRKLKAIRRKEREKTKGPQWYNISAPEITQERKNDLEALRLRGVVNSKDTEHHKYKRNTMVKPPKYFQVGKIVENKQDFYNSRLTNKQRKKTIAEELMSEYH